MPNLTPPNESSSGLTNWSWDDFHHAPRGASEEMVLEPNGWLALIAFLAGPSWVTQEPAEYPSVRHILSNGDIVDTPPTPETKNIIHESMTEYLAHLGIPEPPRETQWRLRLPTGWTELELERACNRAIPETTPGDSKDIAALVHETLREILDEPPAQEG